jgi:hypothetical protein
MKLYMKCVDTGDSKELETFNESVVHHIQENLHLSYGVLRNLYVAHLRDEDVSDTEFSRITSIVKMFEDVNEGLSLILEVRGE